MNRKRKFMTRFLNKFDSLSRTESYWHTKLRDDLPSLPDTILGEVLEYLTFYIKLYDVLDVRDKNGTWYPAVIVNLPSSSTGTVTVHFWSWNEYYDETISTHADRFAPLGYHKQSAHSSACKRRWQLAGRQCIHRQEQITYLTKQYNVSDTIAEQMWADLCRHS